jgi:hypothetical protein
MHVISCPVCEPTNQFVVKLVIVEIESTAISCFIIENLGFSKHFSELLFQNMCAVSLYIVN